MSYIYMNFWDWLCVAFQTQVQNLVEWVKEHEDYNSELQEVEKWLLQMSNRLVTSDSMQTSGMEMATQHLARHKVTLTILSYSFSFTVTLGVQFTSLHDFKILLVYNYMDYFW